MLIMNKVQSNISGGGGGGGGKLNFFRASKSWGRSARMGKCLQKLTSVPAVAKITISIALFLSLLQKFNSSSRHILMVR